MKKLIFIASLIFVAYAAFGQSLKKGQKLIDKNDFTGAESHFEKILETVPGDPSSNFGMGLVYSDSANAKRDLMIALNYINVASINFDKLNDASKNKLEPELNDSIIDNLFTNIDDELYNVLNAADDTVKLNIFINKCPYSGHYHDAVKKRDDLVFEDVRSQNTIDAYEYYIGNFEDSINVAEAVKYRNELIFEQVKDSNNVVYYEKFISDYPDAIQVDEAKALINDLIFESVKDTNTIAAYDEYIEEYPESMKVDEAIKLRNKLAFDEAQKINTVEVYKEFMKNYPDAEQCSIAESQIKDLEKWTCIPGMKVGDIVYNTSYNDLIESYGAENISDDSLNVDGSFNKGTYLYPNEADQRLFIVWKNKKENKYPDRIFILGNKWQTHKGVKLGSTLEELILFNGKDFDLSGFRKKGEGTVISWKGGELGVLHMLGKNFFLQMSYDESKFFSVPEEGLLELTNSEYVSAENEYLKDIDLKVSRMEIIFPE